MRAPESLTFWTLHVKTNFVFRLFDVFLRFRGQSAKKNCLQFAIFNFSEKLQNIFGLNRVKKYGVIVQKSLLKKKVFRKKKKQTLFFSIYVKLATVQSWDQSNKFPLTWSSIKCLLVKKLFRENSVEKFACFANKLRPQTLTTGFSDNWANQRVESLLSFASWWIFNQP